MSKENTIQEFLDTVYQNDSSLILDEESIKRINAFFKEYQEEEKKFDDFLSLLGGETSEWSNGNKKTIRKKHGFATGSIK